MTEKKIEKATAMIFLDLYNKKMNTSFVIDRQNESPDVVCKDKITGKPLNLEISLIQNLPGEIQYILGRGNQPKSPTTETTAVSFYEDVYKELEVSLSKKLLSSYDENTALVLRQASILWSPRDWALLANDIKKYVLKDREENFGAGIWIICTDDDTWPATDTLFQLA